MEKIRILWVSDMVIPTGWSRVAHGILKYLPRDAFDVTGIGVNYFGDPHEYSYPIYPAGVAGDVYGFNRLESILQTKRFDIIYILNDIWIIKEYLKRIQTFTLYKPKIVLYFPVDSRDHDPSWYSEVPMVDKAIVYTKFGKEVAEKALPGYSFDIIPHGIDTEIFRTLDKLKARQTIFKKSELNNSFIFLNANRNQPRKRLEKTLEGFKLFVDGKPENVLLYMHCGVMDSDLNITKLANRLGIEKRFIVTSLKSGVQTVSVEKLNLIYNSADVGVNTCYVKGTNVLTNSGYKVIEDVKIRDVVYSHTGVPSKVSNTFKYTNTEKVVKITTFGSYPIELTPNHKLFADIRPYTHLLRNYKQDVINNPKLRFIRADELLEGSVLTFPVIKDETQYIGEKEAFIYGVYLAEGSTSKSGIRFSLNQSKDDLLRNNILLFMKELFGLDGHIFNYSRNRQTIEYYSKELKFKFESMFGKGAHNKRIPKEVLSITRNDKIQLLKSYFLGDGHLSNKSRTMSFSTVSESLAKSVWFLLTTLGFIAPSLEHKSRGEWKVTVGGSSADELAKIFSMHLRKKNRQQRDKMWADSKYVYFPIRKIEYIDYIGEIYDLEVEGEHSYLTYYAGHNSLGEGWGLPSCEHAVTGAPQIVPDSSSCTDLFQDCGVLIPNGDPFLQSKIMTTGSIVHPEDVAVAMETLYSNKELYSELSRKGKEKFSSPKYSWKVISKQWENVFKEVL